MMLYLLSYKDWSTNHGHEQSMSKLLKTLQSNGETQTPQRAESARKRKSLSTGDDSKSDADTLQWLTTNAKRSPAREQWRHMLSGKC